MSRLISKNPLVKKVVNGEADSELLEMLLTRQLPFTEEEYLESLVFLLGNEPIRNRAAELLRDLSEGAKKSYIAKSAANPKVVYYLMIEALQDNHLPVLEKIIQNQATPVEFLDKIAGEGNSAVLELLLENQIKIIAYPQILASMETNPAINNFIRGKIEEIRDFYLSDEQGEAISPDDIPEDIEKVAAEQAPPDDRSDDPAEEIEDAQVQEKVQTTLQQINSMSVSERIKLALTGTKTERMILIKDPNKMVSLAVVESPKITEDEIALILRDRSLPGEVIGTIASRREWAKNYSIVLEMVQNPKTPLKKSLSLLKQIRTNDLKSLLGDKNVHYVVRNVAQNIYKEKMRIK